MKRFIIWSTLVPAVFLYAVLKTFAQSPEVPITYPGDTKETIARRAQWIEEAKKEDGVSWWGSGRPNEINEIIAEFNKIYPFVKVNYWRGRDVERVTRVETEHSIGRVQVDIMEGGAPENFPRWRKAGIPGKFTDIIPGIEQWDKRSYSKYSDWVMPEHTPMVPMYNTHLVSAAEAPGSWEDLLDPKWKGHLGLTADMKAWVMLALGEGGWGVEKTEKYLARLKQQQPIWASGHSSGHTLLIAGEFKIMTEGYLRYIIGPRRSKAPVSWVKASPVPVPGSYYMFTAKAPNPNSAKLFMEWYFSPNGLQVLEKVTNKGAVYPGSGTLQAKLLEGSPFIFKTEDILIQAANMGLFDRFAKILGVTGE